MEKLDKAYEAVELLNELGLPISKEQILAISKKESQYLREEVLPQVTKEMEPLVDQMHNKFRLEITYSQDLGLEIQVVDKKPLQANLLTSKPEPIKRQRKYIIRIVFPDNHVICSKNVSETLVDVIRYAGPQRVKELGIYRMGDNIISSKLHPNERYRVGQKEVEPGIYVCTYSSTDTKYDQIKRINKELGIGLRIEKVLL